MKYNVQKFKLELVREESFTQDYEAQITSPENLHDFFVNVCRLHKRPQETLVAIALDTRGNIIGFTIASIGGISSSVFDPGTVFRFALCCNACSIAIGHNHPSGDSSVSADDLKATIRLAEAGELLGIPLLDHIIVGDDVKYTSLRQSGLIKNS